ncbi:MAG: polysaccharide biosynthesis tyrosine autokinase [Planctomycetes bacterium]|nr:polysaccharide biosynthesis tyrosine autokinase [Planctomycetota bacterium]
MEESELGLRDYLRVVLKRLWVVVTVVTLFFVGAAFQTWRTIPMYRAASTILIERQTPRLTTLDELYKSTAASVDFYSTEIRLMQSRSFAERVAARMAAAGSGGGAATAGAVQGALRVSTVENSRLLSVTTEGTDPKLITEINNAVVDAYIEDALARRVGDVRALTTQLAKEAEDLRKKLDDGERSLQEFKEKNKLATLGEQANVVSTKLDELASGVTAAEKERRSLDATLDALKQVPADDPKILTFLEVRENLGIAALRTEEGKLQQDWNEAAKKYRPKHPRMIALQSRLETVRKAMVAEVKNVIDGLRARYDAALRNEEKTRQAFEAQSGAKLANDRLATAYASLSREVETTRALYQNLVKRIQEAAVTSSVDANNVSVVDRALQPTVPFRPQPGTNMTLGLVLGVVLGVGLAFLIEHLDNSVKTPEDVDTALKLPYLGHVPMMEGKSDEKDRDRVAFTDVKSHISESFRGIRTAVLFSAPAGETVRTVLVVSSGPREGKTTTSINLAIAMAQAGNRVLLIDADLRRPRIHKAFAADDAIGLSSLLVGESTLEEAAQKTDVENLAIMPSGPIPPNPSELLGSQRMREVLARARERFDRVVIDSPPVIAVTDACVLAPLVDGVVLVVRAAHIGRDVVGRGRDLLRAVKARILGVVLNGISQRRGGYYYGAYDYSYYQSEDAAGGGGKGRSSKRSGAAAAAAVDKEKA